MLLVGQWALKFPWGLCRRPLRGWLANRSEWRQRHRPDVCPPRWTVGHVVLVMPRADEVSESTRPDYDGLDGDEAKPSSWGRFSDEWLLIDYDRSWDISGRGLVGRMYWGNQERLARKWEKLPAP